MYTTAALKAYTTKDLAQMAKTRGVRGWHSMRKDQLVRALIRTSKAKTAARGGSGTAKKNGSASHAAAADKAGNGKTKPASDAAQRMVAAKRNGNAHANGNGSGTHSNGAPVRETGAAPSPLSPAAVTKIQQARALKERNKDLSAANPIGDEHAIVTKDRAVLMVRDAYWLHAYWEVTKQSVERAKAAMAEHWHTARPALRLVKAPLDSVTTSSSVETLERYIEIHGGVRNWYIDVYDPPQTYRIEVGYLAGNGKFHALARSNRVTTPEPGSGDAVDENWTDVAENCERIFAMSGGYSTETPAIELQEVLEERLRRPMGSPLVTRFGVGAERTLHRPREFRFEVDAEMIISGTTEANAYVTIAGEPIKVRPDGTFTVRLAMPDRRQVLPVVASSADGVEQKTIVLAIERNTKAMEPFVRESGE